MNAHARVACTFRRVPVGPPRRLFRLARQPALPARACARLEQPHAALLGGGAHGATGLQRGAGGAAGALGVGGEGSDEEKGLGERLRASGGASAERGVAFPWP